MTALMPRFMRALIRRERNYLARGLITLPQLWALAEIAERDGCTMRALALAAQISPSTATSLVDRLTRLGLLRRQRSPRDRRAVLAVITPKGRRTLRHLANEKRRTLARLCRRVSPADRAVFVRVHEQMLAELQADA